ncbi:urea carboxylase [Actinoplanes cyaneus]|uniref:Urea carboxylase n=1 Tax=Actinoplanes cyaneus TaxID=52696 RepID=A0A919IX83_9ACTN|nr:5-oxoprolinase/urea amidolyase family protein [Actinoplanes cyaneus]MCW2143637.1 urea carboxylase [Actinoplanes cyaneus]GID69730.1 urea carboxylase [Actinoplanes cyaneus]
MFDTLLVANRGEIACRIIRTASRMGLKTVAVFSDADRAAPHVRMADLAVRLGPPPARESYLVVDRVLDAALSTGAGAVHPGYGFLSEDAGFATAVQDAGLAFVGPTPAQLTAFGAKHTARDLARRAGVPMIEGTGLLSGIDQALDEAARIGYPVMLKATGGGGGIGMQACRNPEELIEAYDRVERLAVASFGSGGVFLERFVQRARHVEVQVFGDGHGRVVALGDRDCSLQRRNQKVIEEAPAPGLPGHVRARLHESAAALCASVDYRSAGTVEFVYDAEREEASFLEVNARLQVEHPVTEEIFGIDLVEWMLRLARGEAEFLDEPRRAAGAAVEARVYAEDPTQGHRPSAGLITNTVFPEGVRVDGWVSAGTEVSTAYDPMLAKVIVTAETREQAYARLGLVLKGTRIDGIETNLGLLRAAAANPQVLAALHSTATLADVHDEEPRIVVERPGTMTTVQDWPGRTGLWEVGVPPSGPMDDLSFRLGNKALGNDEGAPGLECTVDGPALRFSAETTICVTGAAAPVTVDGVRVPRWEPVVVPAGSVLDVGRVSESGLRIYVLFAGGLDVPEYLGSASTFTLGQFGGHGGRALRIGDVLRAGTDPVTVAGPVPVADRPAIRREWRIRVTEGPHAAPEFFTREDIDEFYAATFEVHFNSARTGVRLVGPKPRWARTDGGEAGLHPSNIHDTPYSVGAIDFTGDVPILLGPDGPSLGGFVCPATVITAERWKLGQLSPGDSVTFVSTDDRDFVPLIRTVDDGILARDEDVTYRRSGDDNLLVEFGPMTLDLGLRMRGHALMDRLRAEGLDGVVDLTPGIRSLQIHVDPAKLPVRKLLDVVRSLDLPAAEDLAVPSRVVHLPLSWDDPATREAIARYMAGVRDDAPWCPWNIEFIRRVNGLDSVHDVFRTVFDASYLVLGLGDVYLGAPVATPLDPRHRLVTTKYNPARTWTPENAVGIGGAYLCIYGMEGPGGYQFVGRTVQVWNRWARGETPWLLRHFDQIRWYPVGAEELLDLRADVAAGRHRFRIEEGTFRLADHQAFLNSHQDSIAEFRAKQAAAFGKERAAWAEAGEFDPRPEPVAAPSVGEVAVPDGGMLVQAPFVSSVWRVDARPGDSVVAGQPLLALEAMKLETVVLAPCDGVVVDILVTPGAQVAPGNPLVVLAAGKDS